MWKITYTYMNCNLLRFRTILQRLSARWATVYWQSLNSQQARRSRDGCWKDIFYIYSYRLFPAHYSFWPAFPGSQSPAANPQAQMDILEVFSLVLPSVQAVVLEFPSCPLEGEIYITVPQLGQYLEGEICYLFSSGRDSAQSWPRWSIEMDYQNWSIDWSCR